MHPMSMSLVVSQIMLIWLMITPTSALWPHDATNAKSVIAWMAALSIGIGPSAGFGSVVAATLVCILVSFVTNGMYSILFLIKGMMIGYQRYRRKIQGIVAALFALAGVGLIRSAFND